MKIINDIIQNNYEASWYAKRSCWRDMEKYNLSSNENEEYLKVWLQAYKEQLESFLEEVNNKDKYYITLDVDLHDLGDVDHRSFDLTCYNGNIELNRKFYDNKVEAEKDLNTISKETIENFIKSKTSKEIIQWDMKIQKYTPILPS